MYKDLKNLVLSYIGDETWLFRNFHILTPYLYSIDPISYDKENDSKTLSAIENTMNQVFESDHFYCELDVFDLQTLQSIVASYNDDVESCYFDDIDINNEQQVIEFVDNIINREFQGSYHPIHFPIRYLHLGILYDQNWKYLSEIDLTKFCLSYGIPLNLNYEDKIIQILKVQNQIFKGLVSKGYTHSVRECPIVEKLIQRIDEYHVTIDASYY